MAILRWDPFSNMRSGWPFDEEDWSLASWSAGTGDNLELIEEEEKILVKAKVAGVDADDIDINFQDGRLWIKAETKEQKERKGKVYRKMTCSYSYVLDMPNVNVDKEPKATVTKGILTLEFDKAEEAKPRRIAVKAE